MHERIIGLYEKNAAGWDAVRGRDARLERKWLERFAAHAEPGAALMFTSGWADGVRIGEWQGEPLYHSSLDPDEYRRLLADNGFELLDHKLRDPECGESTLWIARYAANSSAGFPGEADRA